MKKTIRNQEISKRRNIKIKKVILQSMVVGVLLLTACKNKEPQDNITPTPTEAISETVTPSITITPTLSPTSTPIPSPSLDDSSSTIDESTMLTEADARSIIESKLDLNIYSINLLSTDVVVDQKQYFSFQVKANDKVITPSLVVNKVSGEIYCYNEDGSISDYSNFPLYNAAVDAVCDWNGIFNRLDKDGKSNGKITLAQGDANSFEFTLDVSYDGKSTDYFGIAQIQGNTATYKDNTGFTLNFVMNEKELNITESGQNPFSKGLFEGTYKLSQE